MKVHLSYRRILARGPLVNGEISAVRHRRELAGWATGRALRPLEHRQLEGPGLVLALNKRDADRQLVGDLQPREALRVAHEEGTLLELDQDALPGQRQLLVVAALEGAMADDLAAAGHRCPFQVPG